MKIILLSFAFVFISVSAFAQQDTTDAGKVGSIEKKIHKLDEVVVTGQYEPQSLKNSVYNVRTISSEMIRLRGATDLKTVLSTELGLRFSNDPATGISDPQLMGMSGASIKVLLDGVPMMDRGTSKESIGQVDINSVERIEIVEGPMSVIYGTDAMAGVINIITKKGIAGNRPGESVAGNWSVTARIQEETAGKEYNAFSKGGNHNGNMGLNWQKNGWQFGASFTRNHFGGWQGNLTGRAKEWMPKEQLMGMATAGYKRGKAEVWYRFNAMDETLNYLGDVFNGASRPLAADKKYLSQRFFHQMQGTYAFNDKLSLNAAASYTDYSRRTQSTQVDLNTGRETLSAEPGAQDKDVFGSAFFRGTLLYKLSPNLSFQPGIELNNNTGSGARVAGEPVINDYAFFLSSQVQLTPGIQLRPGFRLVKNSVYDAPPVIPSLNTKFRLNENLDLRLAYARGYRAPILRELYFVFKDASHDIVGNENLKAENSNSFNGSLSWSGRRDGYRLSSVLSGFYNDFRNLIDIGVDQNAGNINTYLNIYKHKTVGGEWSSTLYRKNLQATLGVAYIGRYNQVLELTEAGSTPEFSWSPELNTNLSYLFPKIATHISFFYKFTGRKQDYTTFTNASTGAMDVKLGEVYAFHLADLTLNKTVNRFVTINGGVRNLFDVTRVRNTGGSDSGAHSTGATVPMSYGRSFFLGLTMQWIKD